MGFCYNFYYYTMSASPKKVKKEGFTEYPFYQNVLPGTSKVIQSFLKPLNADALIKPPSQIPGERFQEKKQYYVKFTNEHVLRAFLCYLGGGQLPGLQKVIEETSVELVEQRIEAFRKYYATSSKELEKIDEAEHVRAVNQLLTRYLFLANVTEAYQEGEDIQESECRVALMVIRKDGGILLAALKRTPPQEDVYVEDDEGEKVSSINCVLIALVCVLLLSFFAHCYPGIIGDQDDHFTFLEHFGFIPRQL